MYFLNKGKLHCQIDGVAMESPLGPILANVFLAQLETQLMTTNSYLCMLLIADMFIIYVVYLTA